MTLSSLALAALLAAAAAPPADGGETAVPGGILTISGKIAAVDFERGRFTVEGAEGPVELGVDRNTGVYLEKRMGTLRSLAAGLPVRACYAGADRKAFWVEVLVKGVVPGRAGLEVKLPSPGSTTPATEGEEEEEGAVPPDATAPPGAPPPERPAPRTAPAPKGGG